MVAPAVTPTTAVVPAVTPTTAVVPAVSPATAAVPANTTATEDPAMAVAPVTMGTPTIK